MGRPAAAAALAAASIVAGALTAAPAVAQERPSRPDDGPRFANVWIAGPLDSIYGAEYARLQETCANADTACFEAELDTTAVAVTPVWSAPDGDTVGHLMAALRPRGRYPYATLLYRPAQGPARGSDLVLREDLGDWGYGITLLLADRAEGWVALRVPAADGPLWVPTDGGRGFGVVDVHGLAGRLWRLGRVAGIRTPRAGGGEVTVPGGVYYVLAVVGDTVRLRPEVPADMPCGGEPAPAPASLPEYAVPLDALMGPAGRLAIEPAYPKGC